MDKETKKLLGIGLVAFAVLKMTQKPKIVYIPQPTGNLGNNYAAWLEYTKAVANSAYQPLRQYPKRGECPLGAWRAF